ncbi:hypothetical protein AWC38_SpisGene12316 [Stylophora pistillata]|uniref:Death domain-containing protein n=1 Tax=Stylophora pistillata TaxID=50429 RepID=A0A2B4S3L9_STYPI|nr:hypothetical protein AWC38_SpisGene12316 [Stylophora pistillata]
MIKPHKTHRQQKQEQIKERLGEVGVCRIRRTEENDGISETLGCGFLVRNFAIVPGFPYPRCLISSDKIFPVECNIDKYYLDFKKVDPNALKTIKLKDITKADKVSRNYGLVVIQIDPSEKCKKGDSLFDRLFDVTNEELTPKENDLRCLYVDDAGDSQFSVKSLKLGEPLQSQYVLAEENESPYKSFTEVTRRGDRKPYGAAIVKNDGGGLIIAGALTFSDDDTKTVQPVFFPLPAQGSVSQWNNPSEEGQPLRHTPLVAVATLEQEAVDGLVKSGKIPKDNLPYLAWDIGNEGSWKNFGRCLNLSEGELKCFGSDHGGEYERWYCMLKAWRERDGAYVTLANTLKKHNRTDLFEQYCLEGSDPPTKGPRQPPTDLNLKKLRISEEDHRDISRRVASKRRRLGRALGLGDENLEAIMEDNANDTNEQSFKILQKWMQSNGAKATYDVLAQALYDRTVMLDDVVEDYCVI